MGFRVLFAAGLAAATLGVLAAHAQVPAVPGHPANYKIIIDPKALPGDFVDLPQSGQLLVPLGPPAGPRATTQPRRAQPVPPGPDANAALDAVRAAVDSCKADGYIVVAAVTDSAGNLKAALAPQGTRPNGIFTALRKDVTVIGFKMSTLLLRQKIAADPSLMAQVTSNMSLLPGGLAIIKDGQLIGAISTSGASAYEEEKCARDGLKKILS